MRWSKQTQPDLVTHVMLMERSNHPLRPGEIKKSMFKFHLVNKGIVKPDAAVDWSKYDAFKRSMTAVYRDWFAWVELFVYCKK